MFCRFRIFEGIPCFSHRSSTLRLILVMYLCSQTYTPWHMAQDWCGFPRFRLKSCLTFFVIHFILISYELLVSSWNFLIKRCESVLFLEHYGILAKTNGLEISKIASTFTEEIPAIKHKFLNAAYPPLICE